MIGDGAAGPPRRADPTAGNCSPNLLEKLHAAEIATSCLEPTTESRHVASSRVYLAAVHGRCQASGRCFDSFRLLRLRPFTCPADYNQLTRSLNEVQRRPPKGRRDGPRSGASRSIAACCHLRFERCGGRYPEIRLWASGPDLLRGTKAEGLPPAKVTKVLCSEDQNSSDRGTRWTGISFSNLLDFAIWR